jgi:segregation and condensation protein B
MLFSSKVIEYKPHKSICYDMNNDNENSVLTIEDIRNNSQDNEKFFLRVIEALLFSAQSPLAIDEIYAHLSEDTYIDVLKLLRQLQANYEGRGIEVIEINKKWLIRTAPDLASHLVRDIVQHKKISKSAIETLGIIAYHQPVTRTEIESIRGVAVSKGTLDILMEMNWIKLGRRRETPGRPVTFMTTDDFLEHFGLKSTKDLPGLKELKEAGFLDSAGRNVTDDEMRSLLDMQQNDITEKEDAEEDTELTQFNFDNG